MNNEAYKSTGADSVKHPAFLSNEFKTIDHQVNEPVNSSNIKTDQLVQNNININIDTVDNFDSIDSINMTPNNKQEPLMSSINAQDVLSDQY